MSAAIKLAWPANPADELVSEYKVWQSKDGSPLAVIATVPAAASPEYLINSPLPGAYQWAISAVNFAGQSPNGPVSNGPAAPSTPPAPTVTVVVV